jgi:hypothetical protein
MKPIEYQLVSGKINIAGSEGTTTYTIAAEGGQINASISSFFFIFIGLCIAFSVILFMVGAFRGILSTVGGDSALASLGGAGNYLKDKEAKTLMQNSIIGLIIILSSWLVINTINPDILKLSLFQSFTGTTQGTNSDLEQNKGNSLAVTDGGRPQLGERRRSSGASEEFAYRLPNGLINPNYTVVPPKPLASNGAIGANGAIISNGGGVYQPLTGSVPISNGNAQFAAGDNSQTQLQTDIKQLCNTKEKVKSEACKNAIDLLIDEKSKVQTLRDRCNAESGVDVSGICKESGMRLSSSRLQKDMFDLCILTEKRVQAQVAHVTTGCNTQLRERERGEHISGESIDIKLANINTAERILSFIFMRSRNYDRIGCYGPNAFVHFGYGQQDKWTDAPCPAELGVVGY